jgi:hypothetical protein
MAIIRQARVLVSRPKKRPAPPIEHYWKTAQRELFSNTRPAQMFFIHKPVGYVALPIYQCIAAMAALYPGREIEFSKKGE